jgi:selenocysteine-specific elongation factor
VIVGTAGHIDHGKTSLVRALTGVDTDRLKDEKARGISIDLGFAYLPTPDGSIIGFIDVPGHERFIHNMLAGATGIDFVLLAIAADDAVMPQTVEHLSIIDLLDIDRGLVALTKADLAGPERRIEAIEEVRGLLDGTRLAGAPILPLSTITGEGLDELRTRLIEAAAGHAVKTAGGRFRMAVDRCFSLSGAGTIATGTVLSGTVSPGDHVVVSPSGLPARVRTIHAQSRPADRGTAGQRCALNLAGDGVSRHAISRGDMVLDPELHAPSERIDATLHVLAVEPKPVGQWMPARLHHAATELGARVVLLADAPIRPGEEGLVQLVLERPIAATAGDRFVLRDTSARRTIGGGRFLDLRAPSRKRRSPQRMTQLAGHALPDPGAALATLLDHAPFYLEIGAFARDRALTTQEMQSIVRRLDVIEIATPTGLVAMARASFVRLKRNVCATLADFHAVHPDLPGMAIERLRLQLTPGWPAPTFRSALQEMARSNDALIDGAWVRLPRHEARLTAHDERMWAVVEPLLSGSERFRPPRVRDIAAAADLAEAEVRRLLKLAGRMGRVDEIAHDHFFLRPTVAEMVEIAQTIVAANGEFTAGQFRDHLSNGRKVAIQILEFFDRHGVTLRRGDLRRMNPHRLDLFAQSPDKSKGRPTAAPDRLPAGIPIPAGTRGIPEPGRA